jgi:hypothetical protein
MGVDAIHTDAQHLGVGRLEARTIALKSSQLGLSATSKVKDIKGQQHMLLAEVIAKICVLAH